MRSQYPRLINGDRRCGFFTKYLKKCGSGWYKRSTLLLETMLLLFVFIGLELVGEANGDTLTIERFYKNSHLLPLLEQPLSAPWFLEQR